ncbi:MAG: thiaminase II [Alphaproteobacteria bacterium]
MSAAAPPDYLTADSLFVRLRHATGDGWRDYVEHPFVAGLAAGTLPEAAFRHYLQQDWLFLLHFARAYALAGYKAGDLAELRDASAKLAAILRETDLHVTFCARWGLDETALEALPEAPATLAYTRFVLETGLRGDLLDLYAALAPCTVGYGEIGARLLAGPPSASNPYAAWIEAYGGAEYQDVARDHVAMLDRLWQRRAAGGRLDQLARVFAEATRLEAAFWQMGMDAG